MGEPLTLEQARTRALEMGEEILANLDTQKEGFAVASFNRYGHVIAVISAQHSQSVAMVATIMHHEKVTLDEVKTFLESNKLNTQTQKIR